ncbi:hypothetical protein EW145_g3496 [Phellinidium pouzarii]|uniref:FAD/NAD(P)-binding domain-containing protein n=1 Tax=Phellinidium pouzarii TaxID=167371 RepID=A0A4S4L6W1_9AGAM|nr:hypothetical protein EW145_g3496 [Phellinidium pouzarii]
MGWFRDLLVFTPGLESRHGHASIRSHLKDTLGQAQLVNFKLDDNIFGQPHASGLGPDTPVIEAAFTFETPRALGKGYVRILYPHDGETPKAMMMMMMVSDWKGHEEIIYESGVYDEHNVSWGEIRAQRHAEIEKDPFVIVVGGAQTGLQVAARLRQHDIKTLVIEQTARVGDVWRNRYPTLALHTPRAQHCFLYQPYPSNWPKLTPRDKLASWLEQYAETQDLVVWTSSTLEPQPRYNSQTKRWDVVINRNGVPIALHPAHIVLATSIYGDPVIPPLLGIENFSGRVLHSSAFAGGKHFAGQRVIVVGAGNTSVDVCQDLVYCGAASVTMVQRSSSAVVSVKYLLQTFGMSFPEGKPTYYSDLASAGMPIGALCELGRKMQPIAEEYDKEMLEGLKKAGFKVKDGPDHSGQLYMVFDRGGGYFVDVGCASLIINGKVKVKQGTELDHLTSTGVVYKDGSDEEADAIILATGWHPIRDKLKRTFGEEVIDRTSELWGIDEEGELRAGYKPSGQPGLWFAAGDFAVSRFYSNFLALYIKGIELGYFFY